MVLDGDGSLLIQLGSLVSIASGAPPNFHHFVFESGLHATSGNQPVPGLGRFDLCALALGAGYPEALSFETVDQLRASLPGLFQKHRPLFVRLRIHREEPTRPWPRVSMAGQVQALRERLA